MPRRRTRSTNGSEFITFVGNQIIKNQVFNQVIGLSAVAHLAAGQNKAHGVSKRINRQTPPG